MTVGTDRKPNMELIRRDLAADSAIDESMLLDLQSPAAFPYRVSTPIVLHETHVSWVILAGDYAFKIKKPLKTDFLDYSTLERREHFCHEEIRLDRRYTGDLYLGVVPISRIGGRARIDASGSPIEYAVKMRRFPDAALLSRRVDLGMVVPNDLVTLARTIADVHRTANTSGPQERFATPQTIARDFHQCLDDLAHGVVSSASEATRIHLSDWADDFLKRHRMEFTDRIRDGYVRECHGDLHLGNVIQLGECLVPFDGIEFNDSFRWIDILNDVAFLVMDFVAHGHTDFAYAFLNAYLQQTGDYRSLALMRWYLVYRALVRAKVAAIAAAQHPDQSESPIQDCLDHLLLADQFTRPETPVRLWITHGLSGSGKSTVSRTLVAKYGAICLRSDVERKRMFGLEPTERVPESRIDEIYGPIATEQTYDHLKSLAKSILRAGFSVIVDATFLKRQQRDRFHDLARDVGADWAMIDCHADGQVLRDRVTERSRQGLDASDATLRVLEQQRIEIEPLSADELDDCAVIPSQSVSNSSS